MPNVFDQFDATPSAGNVFDQFDDRPPTATRVEANAVPEAPGTGDAMLQGTTAAILGNDLRGATPLGPLIRDAGGDFYEGPDGKLKAISNQDFIAQTPDGQAMVYARAPVEGPLDAAREVSSAIAPGLAAGAPTRLPSGGARSVPSQGQVVREAAERQGIDATLPTVTDSRVVRSTAAIGRETPFASGIIERGIARETGQLANRSEEVAETFSSANNPASAGRSVREGLEQYRSSAGKDFNLRNVDDEALQSFITQPSRKSSFAKKASALYETVGRRIPEDARGPANRTSEVLTDIIDRFDDPALKEQFGNQFAGKLLNALEKPLTWSDLRNLRTQVRQLKAQDLSAAEKTIGNAEIKRIESALTEDIYRLTEQAGGKEALRSLQRADRFYGAGATRLDEARKLLRVSSDEGLYAKVLDLASNKRSADIRLLNSVRRSLGDDAWNDVAAVTIRNMGKPTASAADAAADTATGPFSIGSYVTNYEKLSPAGKNVLFGSTGRSDLRQAMDDLVEVAGGMKRTARYSVPTGAGQGINRAGYGALLLAGLFDAWTTAFLGTLGVTGTAVALSNPYVVRGLTSVARATRGTENTNRAVQEYARLRSLLTDRAGVTPQLADQLVSRMREEGQGVAEEQQQ